MMKKSYEKGRRAAASEVQWIYGINPVLEVLRAGRDLREIVVSRGRHEKLAEILEEARLRGIPVEVRENAFFDARFPKGHQGVAARVQPKGYTGIDELLKIPSRKNETPLFIVLDGIEDPRNFGAMLRSAEASAVHGVVIQAYRSAGLGPQVSKSSAGAVEYVPVSVVPNIKHAIERMKEEGIAVVGAEAGLGRPLWEADLTIPLCLVMGSEGKGLRRTVRDQCDSLVSLPMKGRIGSLNVSVAAGIILYEVLRQRYGKG